LKEKKPTGIALVVQSEGAKAKLDIFCLQLNLSGIRTRESDSLVDCKQNVL